MRRSLVTMSVITVGFAAAACGLAAPSATATPLPLGTGQLPAYTATYRITGAAKGASTWTVSPAQNGVTRVTIEQTVSGTTERDVIELSAAGLGFLSAQETLSGGGHHVTISARATGGQVVERAVVDGKNESVTYPLTKRTIVNVAALPTLAGLSLSPKEQSVVTDIVLKHATTPKLGLSTGGMRKISTPAGTFRCVPVTLTASGQTQTAWIDVGDRLLVRYENGQTSFTLAALTR